MELAPSTLLVVQRFGLMLNANPLMDIYDWGKLLGLDVCL